MSSWKKKSKTIKHKQNSLFLFGDAFMQLGKLARSQKHLFEVEMGTFFTYFFFSLFAFQKIISAFISNFQDENQFQKHAVAIKHIYFAWQNHLWQAAVFFTIICFFEFFLPLKMFVIATNQDTNTHIINIQFKQFVSLLIFNWISFYNFKIINNLIFLSDSVSYELFT